MYCIADSRIPPEAKENLAKYAEVILFSTEGITYESISGHPDIFFAQVNGRLIVAPNLPVIFKNILAKNSIPNIEGELPVGPKYPLTARYNVAATQKYLIHNFRYTDSVITTMNDDLDLIHINQGYARCNLLPLKNDRFITSDKEVYKVLNAYGLKALQVEADDILLPGHDHGFFGGCCGIMGSRVFILGNLSKYNNGEQVKNYLNHLHYKIVELYDGPLFDGGSLLFIEK